MTLEQKRQEIRKKINDACPELLKLEFGCEIEYYDLIQCDVDDFYDGIAIVVATYPKVVMGFDRRKTISLIEFTTFDYEFGEEKKILGKPPTLEHLLRTIDKKTMLHMNANGIMKDLETSKIKAYNLTKSPLKQSKEVTDFIYQLICE